ncbi:MAG: anti-sigma factor [Dehalococcoidia bacterium]|nr:MAG: anti-sigma factor [Dehalococcoidia bacterium]
MSDSRRAASHARVALVVIAGIALLVAALPTTVRANGVPTPVNLSYIDLSNWGPRDATGVAELIFAEGIVRVQATGLPRLDGKQYQGWLVNSQAGDAISVGRFNADGSGKVSFKGTLPPIANFGFDLFIITVEPEPDEAPQPAADRSIGGYFSLTGQRGLDGNRSDTGGLLAPGALPNTGDTTLMTDIARFGALAAAMALSLFVGLRLGRKQS